MRDRVYSLDGELYQETDPPTICPPLRGDVYLGEDGQAWRAGSKHRIPKSILHPADKAVFGRLVDRMASTAPPPAVDSGPALIAAERHRQITAGGWSPDHDDTHDDGELVAAAVAYLDHDLRRWPFGYTADGPDGHGSKGGPWVRGRPKLTPDDRVRELVKAGALIAAEIDRLQREDEAIWLNAEGRSSKKEAG
jgi:hypothetical protein